MPIKDSQRRAVQAMAERLKTKGHRRKTLWLSPAALKALKRHTKAGSDTELVNQAIISHFGLDRR